MAQTLACARLYKIKPCVNCPPRLRTAFKDGFRMPEDARNSRRYMTRVLLGALIYYASSSPPDCSGAHPRHSGAML
jgi:hypothetical protein